MFSAGEGSGSVGCFVAAMIASEILRCGTKARHGEGGVESKQREKKQRERETERGGT